jgi:hypothetical protein
MKMRSTCWASYVITTLLITMVGAARGAVVIGFEPGEGYTTGALSPDINTAQQGWSGGSPAQGGFTNNDHASATDESVLTADEAVTTAAAHSGTQSWRNSRGYNSPGQGSPYSPSLPQGVVNDGDKFVASLWFKAVNAVADLSSMGILTGTAAGTDRGNYLAYMDYTPTGLQIYSFDNGAAFHQVDLFSNVDPTIWHQLSMSLTKNGYVDTVSIALDGGSPVVYNAALNEWRQSLGFAYADSSRLKINARQDGDPSFEGFYIDDISYNLAQPASVPEASSVLVWAIAVVVIGGMTWVRRQHATV